MSFSNKSNNNWKASGISLSEVAKLNKPNSHPSGSQWRLAPFWLKWFHAKWHENDMRRLFSWAPLLNWIPYFSACRSTLQSVREPEVHSTGWTQIAFQFIHSIVRVKNYLRQQLCHHLECIQIWGSQVFSSAFTKGARVIKRWGKKGDSSLTLELLGTLEIIYCCLSVLNDLALKVILMFFPLLGKSVVFFY